MPGRAPRCDADTSSENCEFAVLKKNVITAIQTLCSLIGTERWKLNPLDQERRGGRKKNSALSGCFSRFNDVSA